VAGRSSSDDPLSRAGAPAAGVEGGEGVVMAAGRGGAAAAFRALAGAGGSGRAGSWEQREMPGAGEGSQGRRWPSRLDRRPLSARGDPLHPRAGERWHATAEPKGLGEGSPGKGAPGQGSRQTPEKGRHKKSPGGHHHPGFSTHRVVELPAQAPD
jgi:hypothetical protein